MPPYWLLLLLLLLLMEYDLPASCLYWCVECVCLGSMISSEYGDQTQISFFAVALMLSSCMVALVLGSQKLQELKVGIAPKPQNRLALYSWLWLSLKARLEALLWRIMSASP